MTILECQDLAKEIGFDSAEFFLYGLSGKVKCKWLDAYFGLFTIDNHEGFFSVKQFKGNPLVWCGDLNPAYPR